MAKKNSNCITEYTRDDLDKLENKYLKRKLRITWRKLKPILNPPFDIHKSACVVEPSIYEYNAEERQKIRQTIAELNSKNNLDI